VYCQQDGDGTIHTDAWLGVERIHIPVRTAGAAGTIIFDWKATRHAAGHNDLCLTLGYNTAVFCALLRLRGVPNIINMDGIEWRRQKWGSFARLWFWLNDWAGCWLGDHLVADNPGIHKHLTTRVKASKITTIPYGADLVEGLPQSQVTALGLKPLCYWTLIARAEPENSVLEIVRAFSRKPRGQQLVVLGLYEPTKNEYHAAVLAAGSTEVRFLGAIYDQTLVKAIRVHSSGYLHGHQVGGTNPSLVEALGAGNAVIAHDNVFNRWVAGAGAFYFSGEEGCAAALDKLIDDSAVREELSRSSRARFAAGLAWDDVLSDYCLLLARWLPARSPAQPKVRAGG
jgi:glycosyltransferase involved in cell wall biosynthesis